MAAGAHRALGVRRRGVADLRGCAAGASPPGACPSAPAAVLESLVPQRVVRSLAVAAKTVRARSWWWRSSPLCRPTFRCWIWTSDAHCCRPGWSSRRAPSRVQWSRRRRTWCCGRRPPSPSGLTAAVHSFGWTARGRRSGRRSWRRECGWSRGPWLVCRWPAHAGCGHGRWPTACARRGREAAVGPGGGVRAVHLVVAQRLAPAAARLDRRGDGRRSRLRAGQPPAAADHRAGVPFGVLLCYDNAYPEVAARQVAAGARFLVVLSNEAWYRRGAELAQMEALTVCRALETHTPWCAAPWTARRPWSTPTAASAPDCPGGGGPALGARTFRVEVRLGPGALRPLAWLAAVAAGWCCFRAHRSCGASCDPGLDCSRNVP